MKKRNIIQISGLALACSLTVLSACQTTHLQVSKPVESQSSQRLSEAQSMSANGTVFKDQNGKNRLKMSLRSESQNFKTQAFDCGQIANVSLSISGMGIPNSLSVGATYSAGDCTVTSEPLPEIPVGNIRFLTLIAFDSGGGEINSLKTVLRINPGQSTSFEMSQRTWLAAKALYLVLLEASNETALHMSRLNLVAYQQWIDQVILGVSGSFPNYAYINPPRLVNPQTIADILHSFNGSFPNAANLPNFLLPHGSVTINVVGISTGDPLKVWISDLASSVRTENNPIGSSRTIVFPKVPLGNLDIHASNDGNNVSSLIAVGSGSNEFTLDLSGGSIPVADWDDLNGGPAGGRMLSLVRDTGNADVFTVAENGHVFRSNDAGANWTDVSASLDLKPVTALATDNADTVYAGTALGRVYKRKFGATPDADWILLGTGTVNGGTVSISKLYVDPENANRVYAGTLSDGVHEWGGSDWSAVNLGLGSPPFAPVADIIKDPVNNHFYLASTTGGVYKTSTADAPGSGWTSISAGLNSPRHIAYSLALSDLGDSLLLGTSAGGVYSINRSSAFSSWSLNNTGLNAQTGSVRGIVQSTSSGYIYVATENALRKAPDLDEDGIPDATGFINVSAGANPFPPHNPSSPRMTSLIATSGTQFLVGTMGAGIQGWDSSDIAWSDQNIGIHNAFVQDLIKIPVNGSALYAATHSGVMRSTNGGTSWQAMLNVASTGQERIVTSLAVVPGVFTDDYDMYMGTDGDGVFMLNDVTDESSETTAWSNPFVQPANQNIKDMLTLSDGAVLAATPTGTFGICSLQVANCDTNTPYGFTTWTNTDATREAYSLALKPGTVDYVYSGGIGNYHYNTDLTGSGSWTSVSFPASGSGTAVALATTANAPNVLYIGVKGADAGDPKVYKTTNGGGSTIATGNFPVSVKDVYAIYVDQSNANIVYVGTNNGVYMSTDGGVSWGTFNSGSSPLTSLSVSSFALIGTDLYAGTAGRSIFVHSFVPK